MRLMERSRMSGRTTRLLVLLAAALLVAGACGGDDGGDAEADPAANSEEAASEESTESAEPKYDYTPVASAEDGDLIELPEYPFVAAYSSTKDVRGMKTLEMKVVFSDDDLGAKFSPSVLIGSPGQKITLTGFKADDAPSPHTFTIDSSGINMQWGDKKPKPVTVTFPKNGELGFYCKFHVPTNRRFMAGLLQVKT